MSSAASYFGQPFVAPTGDQLVEAVLAGEDAVERVRARFRGVSPTESVSRLVVQAVDPLLLGVVLGSELAAAWVPVLQRSYDQARRASPATFMDFGRAWDLQRRRWQPLLDDADAGPRAAAPPVDSLAPSAGPDRTAAVRGAPAAASRGGRRGPRPADALLPAAAAAASLAPLAPAPADPVSGRPLDVQASADDLPEPEPGDLDDGESPEASDPEAEMPLAPVDRGPAAAAVPVSSSRPPQAGRCGLAVAQAARRADFDLVTVFDGCLSELDAEPHWESFRFGAASLHRGSARSR